MATDLPAWLRSMRVLRPTLEQLVPKTNDLRSALLVSPQPDAMSPYARHWSHPIAQRTVQMPSGNRGVPTQSISPVRFGAQEHCRVVSWIDNIAAIGRLDWPLADATTARQTVESLGKLLPVDQVRSTLPDGAVFLIERIQHDAAVWHFMLHSLAWTDRVPGLSAERWVWERTDSSDPCSVMAWRINEKIEAGADHVVEIKKHRPELDISTDWISVLDGSIVLASLVAMEWLSGQSEPANTLWLSPGDVAELLGKNRATITNEARRGKIRARQQGGKGAEWQIDADSAAERWASDAGVLRDRIENERGQDRP